MILSYYIAPEKVASLTDNEVIDAVCEWFGIKEDALFSRSRKQRIVAAKHLTRYIFRYFLKMTLPKIQEYFNGSYSITKRKIVKKCDHSTVIHSLKTVKRLLEAKDMIMCKDFMEVSTKLGMIAIASDTLNKIQKVGHCVIVNLEEDFVYERPKAEYSNHTPFNISQTI